MRANLPPHPLPSGKRPRPCSRRIVKVLRLWSHYEIKLGCLERSCFREIVDHLQEQKLGMVH